MSAHLHVSRLHHSRSVSIADVRCRPHCRECGGAEWCEAHQIVFVRAGVFVSVSPGSHLPARNWNGHSPISQATATPHRTGAHPRRRKRPGQAGPRLGLLQPQPRCSKAWWRKLRRQRPPRGSVCKSTRPDLAPERWHGPETILRKVLAPLVDNALKFTPQGTVTLAVEPHAPGLALSVIDTGVGLTPQQLEWIQIPAAQVDGGLTRRNSGIGLGLLLARRLTQAMGGELTLNGKPNQGVTARFTVKARPADASTKVAA